MIFAINKDDFASLFWQDPESTETKFLEKKKYLKISEPLVHFSECDFAGYEAIAFKDRVDFYNLKKSSEKKGSITNIPEGESITRVKCIEGTRVITIFTGHTAMYFSLTNFKEITRFRLEKEGEKWASSIGGTNLLYSIIKNGDNSSITVY